LTTIFLGIASFKRATQEEIEFDKGEFLERAVSVNVF
jgi:hypothetical protein